MSSETRICQNCKNGFIIESDDFDFYERIKVPPPTFCPPCRLQRRLTYRNERVLYKRTCDLCKKSVIGPYRPQTPFPVYCQACWWSDKWDATDYGQEYDPSKPFLSQWAELQKRVPRQHINNTKGTTLVNSDYTNCAGELKNCYLVFGAMGDEDCAYAHYTNYSRNCIDILYCIKCENCYDCLDIEGCYNLHYSQSCFQSRDSAFLFDCRNCSDCIGCVGLRNKRYYILNQPYSREDFLKKKEELRLDTRAGLEAFRKEYRSLYLSMPRKYYHGQMNNGFSGDYIANAENTYASFYVKQTRGCKFLFWCNNARDVYDYFSWGDIEFSYECVSGGEKNYRCLFTDTSWGDDKELEYCSLCMSSASDLFGCIGLRGKRYCILNKQYSPEEYAVLRKKIVADMERMPYHDARGLLYRYGEFPPIELSPFPYADTVAQEHFSLTKKEILGYGYPWEEPEKHEYAITMSSEKLPGSIGEVRDEIMKEVIGCEHKGVCRDRCTEAFKITAQELQFYRKMGIPIPRLCHNCRHAERVAMRNPLALWHRKCMCDKNHPHHNGDCRNEFETAYAPGRPEIIFCEQCYNAEVA